MKKEEAVESEGRMEKMGRGKFSDERSRDGDETQGKGIPNSCATCSDLWGTVLGTKQKR